MKSEQKLIEARNSYSEGLKEIIAFVNKSENLSQDKEDELVEYVKGGLLQVQSLDWILNDEDLDFGEFCKVNQKDITEELGLGEKDSNEESQ
jgi:hypothetical protein